MTETDRELLEFAAKAAGYAHFHTASFWSKGYRVTNDAKEGWEPWNPLTDDGDALRLAVKCNLAIAIEEGQSWAHAVTVFQGSPVQHDGRDPYAATRRAIVRAAAEVGRAMGLTSEAR